MKLDRLGEIKGASLLFLLAVIFAGLVNIHLLFQFRRTHEQTLFDQASVIVNLLNSYPQIDENYRLLSQSFGLNRLIITDSLGNFIYDTFRQQGVFSEIHKIDLNRLRDDKILRRDDEFVSMIYDRQGNIRYAFIYIDLTNLSNTNLIVRWQIIYLTISLLFIAALGVLLVYRVTRPISSVMDRITNLGISAREEDFLRQSFDEMMNRLKRKEEEIQKMASLIAHEFRNSLAAISGLIRTKPRRKNAIALIEKECREMENLIKHIIDFTRPVKLNVSEINVNELLEDLLVDFHLPRGIMLRKSFNPTLTLVKGDWELLNRVFVNILKNAVEAEPKEYITVITKKTDDSIIVEISDDGVGITADNVKKILDPFFSLKEGGIGLGLSFVKKVMEMHEGLLEVDSKKSVGTTIRIELPAK